MKAVMEQFPSLILITQHFIGLMQKENETQFVASWIFSQVKGGIPPEQIGIFVRSDLELKRATSAIDLAKLDYHVISPKKSSKQDCIVCGTMHDAKGLEFRKRRGYGM